MPSLHWIGKEAVVNHHHTVPFHLLRDVPELSVGEPGAGNLIVQGDNLVALKALLPYYAGQVKCIYIDPPYNTGNEGWVYNDNVNSPLIREWLGRAVGKEAEDLSRHDKWLCMMYPRLALLRQFLRDDGALFVSIDDNEAGHVRLLCDGIFGVQNFVCSFIWEKKHTRANDAKYVSDNHDFVLLYAKSKNHLTLKRLARSEAANARFANPDNDARGPWISQPLQVKTPSPNYIYEITTPCGRVIRPPAGRSWAFGPERYRELVEQRRIYFGPDGTNVPRLKKFLTEVGDLVPVTIWPREEVGDNQEAKIELKDTVREGLAFDSPKPARLLQRILQIATNPGDLILDSFAGSGTTGHAVLQLNAQSSLVGTGSFATPSSHEIPGTQWNASLPGRRFILVEMEPKIAREITAERVKRVAQGYTNAKGEKVDGLGGGFRFCELGEPLFDQHGQIRESVTFADLARHVYFTETGEPLPDRSAGFSPLQLPHAKEAMDVSSRPANREAKRPEGRAPDSPFLGECRGVGVYLLFNGILGDKSANGGNILTRAVLAKLPKFDGPKVIYASGCLLGRERLQAGRITFRQTPYEIKVA